MYGRNELKAGESCYCQFRLQEPIVAMSGDRYIIRRFSPLDTIGGGEVLDPSAYKLSHKKSLEDLTLLYTDTLTEKIALKVKRARIHGIKAAYIEGWIKEEVTTIKHSIEALKEKGILMQYDDMLFHNTAINTFGELIKKKLADFHEGNPLKPGMLKEELRVNLNLEPRLFGYLIASLKDIVIEKEIIRLVTFRMSLSEIYNTLKTTIIDIYEKAKFKPPMKEELSQFLKLDQKQISDILKFIVEEGSLIRVNDSMYLTSSIYHTMIEKLKTFFNRKSEMSLKEFKDLLNTTSKYPVPLLEYLDSQKITKRVGEIRKLLIKDS